jgi:hypothetical protein
MSRGEGGDDGGSKALIMWTLVERGRNRPGSHSKKVGQKRESSVLEMMTG